MLRSLFSGITGLRAHQTMMDVVGNNIANVNTVGYKTSQAVFKDTLSQLLKGAGAPQDGLGGTNPAQIGLGVQLAAVTTNFTQGAAQLTGRSTDLMIQGDGFFTVRSAGETLYTRAGSLSLDANGFLVTPDGGILQGWAGNNGVIDTNSAVTDVKLPIGTLIPPVMTDGAALGGNLPGDSAIGTTFKQAITTYDGQGKALKSTFTFTKTTDTTWTLDAVEGLADGSSNGTATQQVLTFDANGVLVDPAPDPANANKQTMSFNGLGGNPIEVDLTKLSGFAGPNTVAALSQTGSAMGSLQSFAISPDGTVVGVFSNGLKQPLSQIALASFNNPGGLEKVGNTMFRSSVNSGPENVGVAGSGGRGLLAGGVTEMSNVDLAAEFTNLIISQRGFQANSRVITASDEILQDLVNMKR